MVIGLHQIIEDHILAKILVFGTFTDLRRQMMSVEMPPRAWPSYDYDNECQSHSLGVYQTHEKCAKMLPPRLLKTLDDRIDCEIESLQFPLVVSMNVEKRFPKPLSS